MIVAMIIIIIISVTMSIFIFMSMQVPSNTLAEVTVYFHHARQGLFGALLGVTLDLWLPLVDAMYAAYDTERMWAEISTVRNLKLTTTFQSLRLSMIRVARV